MDQLGSRERGQLKSLLAGESLPTDAQNSIINILRTEFPDFFSQLTAGLEKTKSENNNEVAKYLKFNTGKTRQILKKQKLAFLTQQEQDELGSALEKPLATEGVVYQQGQAPADQEAPVGTSGGGGGGGMPGMPSMSAPAIHPVFRTKPPVAETPKPDIAIANKSGYVAEKGDASKLVSARSDGSIIQSAPKNPTIHIADKSGNIIKTYNVKSPGWLKNFGSNAQIFAKKNSVRIGNGLKDMFGNVANAGGRTGLKAINHGGNFLSNLSSSRARLSSSLGKARSNVLSKGGSKRVAIAFAGAFFLIFFMGALGGALNMSSTGEASPNLPGSAGSSGLNYTLPIKDPYVQPLDIKDQVKTVFSGAKLEYWDKIVQQSQAANFNPALALALWIEETGASHTTLIKNGGSEIPVNGSLSKGHLGCAPLEDQTIDESLTCLFKMDTANNFTNEQFAKFMALYSGGPAGAPFSNNPDFPANIKSWYSKLVPAGTYGALTELSVPAGSASSCPAIGTISTPYGYNIAGYPANEINEDCGNLPLCHNGIDIVPDATDISVRSTITGKVTAINSTETAGAKGKFLEINDSSSGLTITLEHLAIINSNKNTNLPISLGDTISAGDTIGTIGNTGNSTSTHLHYKIKKGVDPVNPLHYLGSSATLELKLDSNHSLSTYTTIDDITKISYDGVTPNSGNLDNWGRCNQ